MKSAAVACLAILLPGFALKAEVIAIREAEDTTITCASKLPNAPVLWASNKFIPPACWGRAAGDKLEFDLNLDTYQDNLKLGVRYAYLEAWHRRDIKVPPGPRELTLVIDDLAQVTVPVPDTKGWNHFEVTEVALPPLQPGYHKLALLSPTHFSDTNVDTFILFREPVDRNKEGLLRPTRLVESEKGIVLCASDRAELMESPESTHKVLQGLYQLMSEDFQKHKNEQVFFHLTDRSRWWNTKADVVLNKYGIYVLADGNPHDRAEWCWTLADYFIRDSGIPAWFGNSSSRVCGWMDWLPSLVGSTSDLEAKNAADVQAKAIEFLASDTSRTDQAEVVQMAVRLKYGNDIFQRFWTRVRAHHSPEATGALPALNKYETIGLLSEVAGEDTLPYFKRWTGFKDEGPVDPLVIVLQAN